MALHDTILPGHVPGKAHLPFWDSGANKKEGLRLQPQEVSKLMHKKKLIVSRQPIFTNLKSNTMKNNAKVHLPPRICKHTHTNFLDFDSICNITLHFVSYGLRNAHQAGSEIAKKKLSYPMAFRKKCWKMGAKALLALPIKAAFIKKMCGINEKSPLDEPSAGLFI